MVVVEPVIRAVMGISDRITVLHPGEEITKGPAQVVAKDERVIEADLGKNVCLP